MAIASDAAFVGTPLGYARKAMFAIGFGREPDVATRDVSERTRTRSGPLGWRRAKSSARVAGVVASCGAIGVAVLVASGTELASPPSASAFNTATASPSATVSGVAGDAAASNYLQKIQSVDQQMESALQAVANGVQNQQWDAARAACQQLSGSGEAFRATLPSPDSRITPRVRQAADDIGTASGMCAAFGPSTTQADWDQFIASINNARSDLISAAQILKHPR